MSDWVNVTSGVPQGSVLGPLLFILYVNDSLQGLDRGKIMFADDVKLWQVIKGPNDQAALQTNLHRLQTWSEKWLLEFNVQKCAVLHLRPTDCHSSDSVGAYHLKGVALPTESSQKDLGVWIQSNMKPTLQCIKASKKATGVLHAIKRAFITFDEDLFGKIYGTFVRPHLEYESSSPLLEVSANLNARGRIFVLGRFYIESFCTVSASISPPTGRVP
ncbi:hypothetical protein SprV_0100292100 [Sparganum proliferum]